jgi:hypothetical protein
VGIYVPLDGQLSRLFVDGTKVAGLFLVEGRLDAVSNEDVNRDANADVSGRVPIGPLRGRLLDQVDVLALRVLLCAEESHCGSSRYARGNQMAYIWYSSQ